jgi:hypothetical protein
MWKSLENWEFADKIHTIQKITSYNRKRQLKTRLREAVYGGQY